ncbi:MAG: peptidase M16, partial [Coriobacteriaceae bacterium]|nr:peptidase M16 [Coriobacteriaceae bacterium]
GIWQLASRVLSLDYLWNECRVKGGAYGAGFKADRSGAMQFYSYRDPNLDATLARFDATASWLCALSLDAEEMLGYIISSVAGYDTPKKPREIARRQDAEFFGKLDADWMKKARNEVLKATPKDIKNLAEIFERLAAQDVRCVFGNRTIIEEASTTFEIIDLLG